jgi:hypothetical protein
MSGFFYKMTPKIGYRHSQTIVRSHKVTFAVQHELCAKLSIVNSVPVFNSVKC